MATPLRLTVADILIPSKTRSVSPAPERSASSDDDASEKEREKVHTFFSQRELLSQLSS